MASLTTNHPAAKHKMGEADFHGLAPKEEKVSQIKKIEFVRTADKLKKQIEKLENERRLNVLLKNIWKDGCEGLEEMEKDLQKERQSEMDSLQKQLLKIHHGVKRFQRQLTDVRPTPELIEKLKEIMTEVENSINTFKEDQRFQYEELLKEERTCSLEVSAFERKMDAWSVAGKADGHILLAPPLSTKVGMARAQQAEPPPEVLALETFLLQTGGMQGGWDPYDHQSFLKVWTKHQGRPAYRKEAQLYLPGHTLEDLQEHEDWYLNLLHLQKQKKEAIQRWRSARQQSTLARLQLQAEEEKEAAKREAQAEALRRQAEEERREAALRLEDWRERRRKQKQKEEEEEQRQAEEVQRRRRAQEERRRQQEVKLALEAHLRERREEEEAQALRIAEKKLEEEEERRRTAGQEIRRFQERDLHKMESKLQEKQLKEKHEEEKQKRLAKLKEKVVVNVSHDPSRVCKPTRGWEEKTKEIGPTGGGGPVQHMFHRAVPTWRQGL